MRKKLMAGLILFVLIACISVVSATTGVGPTTVPNNQATCEHILPGSTEFRLDDPVDGPNSSGGFHVNIGVSDSQNIWWNSNYPVDAVIVKDGSNDANYYTYDPAASGDTGLKTTLNPAGKVGATSHIAFCYHPSVPSPEFPAVALPVGMIIGFLGVVLFVRGTQEN